MNEIIWISLFWWRIKAKKGNLIYSDRQHKAKIKIFGRWILVYRK